MMTIHADPVGKMTLLSALAGAGEVIYAPCGGDGRCGRCRVIARGALSEPDEVERARLSADELERGVRLACRARAMGDVFVEVDERFPGETSSTTPTPRQRVSKSSPVASDDIGVAADIGTTTVALSLVDMKTGERLAEATAYNPQAVWGADVLSRIAAVAEGKTDAASMQRMIRDCVYGLRRMLGARDDAPTVVVGNTVMMSFFAGVDPTPIGRAPFLPPTLFGCENDRAYLPRCVSGFFGADAMASVIAAIYEYGADEDFILADVGTNGEVAGFYGGRLYTCSAAAGPALEGAGISCGMTAAAGAIDSVSIRAGRLCCHVIGSGDARGFCGSGLIDAVACLSMLGVIDRDGNMAEPYEISPGVFITPEDVRAVQLSKAAIRAAQDTVSAGHDPVPLIIAGGFGSGLSVQSCVRIGLIPPELSGDVRVIGNGALRGAELMLVYPALRELEARLAENAVCTELSGSDGFARRFLDSLGFFPQ